MTLILCTSQINFKGPQHPLNNRLTFTEKNFNCVVFTSQTRPITTDDFALIYHLRKQAQLCNKLRFRRHLLHKRRAWPYRRGFHYLVVLI